MELAWREFGVDIQAAADETTGEGAQERRTFTATIKAQEYDRANNKFIVEGISVPRTGVPILWHHNQQGIPLGRASNFETTARTLKAKLSFSPSREWGAWAIEMIESGDMDKVSGGFTNVERRFVDDPDDPKNYWLGLQYPEYYIGRTDIISSELVEVSLVNVPADPRAQIRAGLELPQFPDINEIRAALGLPRIQGAE